MTRTPSQALLLLTVLVSPGFALRVADASALVKRDEGPRALAALEELREQALNEAARALELVEASRIERRFPKKRGHILRKVK